MTFPHSFITGTDTDAGKTIATASLLRYLADSGVRCAGVKPIASGFELRNGERVNQDIERLKAASNVVLPDQLINSYAFEPAIAPHIAAADQGVSLNFDVIVERAQKASSQVDTLLVEGVGGWAVPLAWCNEACPTDCAEHKSQNIASLAKALGLPVILVVGLRLGCLNHALLSAQAILADGVNLLGWVACEVQADFNRKAENMHTLKRMMPAPLLFEIPHMEDAQMLEHFKPEIVTLSEPAGD